LIVAVKSARNFLTPFKGGHRVRVLEYSPVEYLGGNDSIREGSTFCEVNWKIQNLRQQRLLSNASQGKQANKERETFPNPTPDPNPKPIPHSPRDMSPTKKQKPIAQFFQSVQTPESVSDKKEK